MTKKCPVCTYELPEEQASCPQCGFKFLGTTQEFKPIMFDNGQEQGDKSIPILRVVKGPQVGAVYKLEADSVTIGRNPQCDIFLNDMTVSRMHAKIDRIKGSHVINDVDSYNGVWVNNSSVTEKALKPGDLIQIGKFAFIYDDNE